MKRIIIFLATIVLCISMFSTTVFAYETETSSVSAFTAGSAGMFCLDENNVEHFISADEILAYNVPKAYSAPSYDPPGMESTFDMGMTTTAKYPKIVLVQATFNYTDKPSETRYSTGSFCGPKGILTCAHGVYDKEKDMWASEVCVMTKYNYGAWENKYYSKEVFIGSEFKKTDRDDWAIITINETSKVGYYGFSAAESADEVDRLPVTLLGFSPYEFDRELMKSDGVLKVSRTLGRALPHVYSTCKVSEGMSGGPYLEDNTWIRGLVRAKHSSESQGLLINKWLYNVLYEYSGR